MMAIFKSKFKWMACAAFITFVAAGIANEGRILISVKLDGMTVQRTVTPDGFNKIIRTCKIVGLPSSPIAELKGSKLLCIKHSQSPSFQAKMITGSNKSVAKDVVVDLPVNELQEPNEKVVCDENAPGCN